MSKIFYYRELSRTEWLHEQAEYLVRVTPHCQRKIDRSSRQEKHPVEDFLFEYYSHRPAHLKRWSPGIGVLLKDAKTEELSWSQFYKPVDGGLVIPLGTFPEHRQKYLRWSLDYLKAIANRDPTHSCMGMHEWAMLYRADEPRHQRIPLRVSKETIIELVEQQGLRCTHYDAYRFFTAEASPRNRWKLSREVMIDHDQPGCIHVNMDLYQFAYKITPYIDGKLLADVFELTSVARELDMRASPYDVSELGLENMILESREGREVYVSEQKAIAERAAVLRSRMILTYERLL